MSITDILKIVLAIFIMILSFGMMITRYLLRSGVHVPTNKEIIASYHASKLKKEGLINNDPQKVVKAQNIKKLKGAEK